MSSSETRAEEITNALVDFVCLDLRPISAVEGVGFRRLVYKLEAGFRVPSHTTIAARIRRKHVKGQAMPCERLTGCDCCRSDY